MLLPVLLLTFGLGVLSSEPLGAVTNLTIVQEGFGGFLSVTWGPPANFPSSPDDSYLIKVTGPKGDVIKIKTWIQVQRNLACVWVVRPQFGKVYTVAITPTRAESEEEKGSQTEETVTLYESDNTRLPSVFQFEYGGWDKQENKLRWEWSIPRDAMDSRIWYFVRACEKSSDSCKHAITVDQTMLLGDLSDGVSYSVEIFVHAKGPEATDPVRTSLPLQHHMETVPWEWPHPENLQITPGNDSSLQDTISYTINWTLERKPRLDNVIINVYEGGYEPYGVLALKQRLGEDTTQLSMELDYNTRYAIRCDATYDRGLGQIAEVQGIPIEFSSAEGPSEAVTSFKATQIDNTKGVTLTWDPPQKPNGNITYYNLRITTTNSIEVHPAVRVDSTETSTTQTIEDTTSSEYHFSITPITERSGKEPLIGRVAFAKITFLEEGGLSPVAIALIVIGVLALVGGAAFFVVKRRRQ